MPPLGTVSAVEAPQGASHRQGLQTRSRRHLWYVLRYAQAPAGCDRCAVVALVASVVWTTYTDPVPLGATTMPTVGVGAARAERDRAARSSARSRQLVGACPIETTPDPLEATEYQHWCRSQKPLESLEPPLAPAE